MREPTTVSVPRSELSRLFEPSSIAVIGASADPAKIGGRPLHFLREAGYEGRIYPVNPRYEEIDGIPCLSHVAQAGAPPDVALVALSGEAAITSIEAAGEFGVPYAIVFGAGFAEAGNFEMQARMDAARRRTGIRVLGPNSLGLVSTESRAVMSFATSFEDPTALKAGTVSVLSQSGALGAFMAAALQREGVGLRYWVSTGNESDVHFAEMLQFLAEDHGTTSIACYLEGTARGAELEAALAAAHSNGKRVSILKVGRSAVARDAVRSHTAALAGSDLVFDAVFRRHGAVRVGSPRSLVDVAALASDRPSPDSSRVCVVTISGGVGAWMADAFVEAGASVPTLDGGVVERLAHRLPSFARTDNPVDLTGHILNDPALLADAIEILGDQPDLGALVIALGLQQELGLRFSEEISRASEKLRASNPARVLAVAWMEGPSEALDALRAASVPVFTDFGACVSAVGSLLSARPRAAPVDGPPARGPLLGRGIALDERDAKRFLSEWGFRIPASEIATSEDEAAAAAHRLGTRVVLKGLDATVSHKSDKGLVHLDLVDEAGVRGAYRSIVAAGGGRAGVLVETQVSDGVELLIGLIHDATFGPTVVVASGGTLTELVRDQAVAVAPVTADEALELIRRTRSGELITGFRGSEPLDVTPLVGDICRLSDLGVAHTGLISSLDINPIKVTREGTFVLDAVVNMFNEAT